MLTKQATEDIPVNPHLLQKRLNQLYQQRKQLVQKIKLTLSRKRLILDGLKEYSGTGEQGKPESTAQLQSQESLPEHRHHLNTEEEDIKKVVDAQKTIQDRNRRMFGGLNGHLKKAERTLKSQQEKARGKMVIEDKAIRKEQDQASQLQQSRLKEVQQQLQQLMQKKQQSRRELLLIQNSLLKQKFVTYVSDLSHCMLTSQQPSIAWQPAHPNPSTLQTHASQTLQRQKQADLLSDSIEHYQDKFDYSKYTQENEKEYYNYKLDDYFRNKLNFISTQTKPSLMWLPGGDGQEKYVELMEQRKSGSGIMEECGKIKEQNEQHYVKMGKEQLHEGQASLEEGMSDSGQ